MTRRTKRAVIAALLTVCASVAGSITVQRWNRARCQLRLTFSTEGAVAASFPRGQTKLTLAGDGYRTDRTVSLFSPPKVPYERQLECTDDLVRGVWRSWDLVAIILPRAPDGLDISVKRGNSLLAEQRVTPRYENEGCTAAITFSSK